MNRRTLLIVLIGALSLVVVPSLGRGQSGAGVVGERSVRLVIDYGDGVQKHFVALAWKKGMTVLDLLEAAQKHPRGIKFAYRGKGSTAFLTAIDGVQNEGRGRNWTYLVNKKLPDHSFAVHPVGAGDTVLWRYGKYR